MDGSLCIFHHPDVHWSPMGKNLFYPKMSFLPSRHPVSRLDGFRYTNNIATTILQEDDVLLGQLVLLTLYLIWNNTW